LIHYEFNKSIKSKPQMLFYYRPDNVTVTKISNNRSLSQKRKRKKGEIERKTLPGSAPNKLIQPLQTLERERETERKEKKKLFLRTFLIWML
jgi:hypothetical protein